MEQIWEIYFVIRIFRALFAEVSILHLFLFVDESPWITFEGFQPFAYSCEFSGPWLWMIEHLSSLFIIFLI